MSPKQQPRIVEVQELKTEAKWLQMVKINWQDEDGKDVSSHSGAPPPHQSSLTAARLGGREQDQAE